MRSLLLFTLFLGAIYATTGETERRVGANLVVIHEYGSKKIFRQGNLAMGSTKESKTGKLGAIGVREGEINYSYPAKSDLIGVEKVKDVKFYEIMPEKFSYFERGDLKKGIYEGMITSIYFTGEGKLAEGGIHSKKFKNKFNINNFLGWCHKDFIKHCRRLLMAEFDLSNMVYFSVYNPKSANGAVTNSDYYANSTSTKDINLWNNTIKPKLLNESLDALTKEVLTKKVDQLDSFFKIVKTVIPSYYSDYAGGGQEPYIFMSNKLVRDIGLHIENPINIWNKKAGFKGAMPPFFFADQMKVGEFYPYQYIEGNKKYFAIPYQRYYREKATDTDRGGDKGTKVQGKNVFLEMTNPDLSYLNLAYAGKPEGNRLTTANNTAMYSVFTDKIAHDISDPSHQFGNLTNRSKDSIAFGNYLINSKNGWNSASMFSDYAYNRNVYMGWSWGGVTPDPDGIKKELAKGYINSVRIINRQYGINPIIKKEGNDVKARTTFALMNEYHHIENFFDPESMVVSYNSRMKEYINLNGEAPIEIKNKQREVYAPEDSEAVYTVFDEEISKVVKAAYHGTKEGGNYTSLFKLSHFSNFYNYNLGHNTIPANMGKSDFVQVDSNTHERTFGDNPKIINGDLDRVMDLSKTAFDPLIERWLPTPSAYLSRMSCILDSACYMGLIATSGIYGQINELTEYANFTHEDYPFKLEIERSAQVPAMNRAGVYAFMGTFYNQPYGYSGAYTDDPEGKGPKKNWCVWIYKPEPARPTFKEVKDSFYRYKHTREANWIYLLPDENLANSETAVFPRQSFKAQIDKKGSGLANLPEKYVFKNGATGSYIAYMDVGVGGACPNHNGRFSPKFKSKLELDKFGKPSVVSRPANLNPEVFIANGIEDYINKVINEKSGEICRNTGVRCNEAKTGAKSLTPEEYLKTYDGNYLTHSFSPYKYNPLSIMYYYGNEEQLKIKDATLDLDNKVLDAKRYIIEEGLKYYYSIGDIGDNPSSKRPIMVKNPSAASVEHDYNTTSLRNLCAKRHSLSTNTTTDLQQLIACLDETRGSMNTPPPPPPKPQPKPQPPVGCDFSFQVRPNTTLADPYYEIPDMTGGRRVVYAEMECLENRAFQTRVIGTTFPQKVKIAWNVPVCQVFLNFCSGPGGGSNPTPNPQPDPKPQPQPDPKPKPDPGEAPFYDPSGFDDIITSLYMALYNRVPEGSGHAYWKRMLPRGKEFVANAMLDTPISRAYFSGMNTNFQFVEHIYRNMLNKTSATDPDGIRYWVGKLEGGQSRGAMVVELLDLLLHGNFAGDPNQALFKKRVRVGDITRQITERIPDSVSAIRPFQHILADVGHSTDPASIARSIKSHLKNAGYLRGSDFKIIEGLKTHFRISASEEARIAGILRGI